MGGLPNHTKEMLGIYGETEEQKRVCAEAGLESIPFIADDGTFINPKVEDEVNDWGNRARLLQAHRALRKDIPQQCIQADRLRAPLNLDVMLYGAKL
jgi:hypothetical protein